MHKKMPTLWLFDLFHITGRQYFQRMGGGGVGKGKTLQYDLRNLSDGSEAFSNKSVSL